MRNPQLDTSQLQFFQTFQNYKSNLAQKQQSYQAEKMLCNYQAKSQIKRKRKSLPLNFQFLSSSLSQKQSEQTLSRMEAQISLDQSRLSQFKEKNQDRIMKGLLLNNKKEKKRLFYGEIWEERKPICPQTENERYFQVSKLIFDSFPSNDSSEDEERNFTIKLSFFRRLLNYFLSDPRIRVLDTLKHPFSAIGLVSGLDGEQEFFGTGCLIGPNIVLTCAHNCFIRKVNKKKSKLMKNLKFSPGLNGKKGRTNKVKQAHFPEEYMTKQKEFASLYDYAILVLEEDLTEEYGFLGVDSRNHNLRKNALINICGYPGEKVEDDQKTMWIGSGNQFQLDDNFIYYQLTTSPGQSGSPLYIIVQGRVYVVGIHIRGVQKLQRNMAVRITGERIARINQWVGSTTYSLDLRHKDINDEEIKYLNEKEWMQNVEELNLYGNGLTKKGVLELSMGDWSHLLQLRLSNNMNIGDESMKYLKAFYSLKELWIWKCGITDNGLSILSEGKFDSLNLLNIGWNQIGNEGIQKFNAFPELATLCIEKIGLTDEGIDKLVLLKLKYLRKLDIIRNDISEEGREKILAYAISAVVEVRV